MLKVTPTTKEQLVYYLLTNISLGTYDKRFLTNIQAAHVTFNKPVTTNQSDLLIKIVKRYQRQLARKELDIDVLVALPWSIKPITSLPEFTEARVSIKDNEIIVQSPFKANFVKEFREYDYSAWDKESKSWSCPLSEETLKYVIDVTNRHYDKVNHCNMVKDIICEVSLYSDAKYWDPTLVEANGRLYIAAINPSLDKAISDMELSTDLYTIARLAYLGVVISEEIKSNLSSSLDTQAVSFSSERNGTLEYDSELVLKYLLMVNTDFVLMTEWFGVNKEFSTSLKLGLANAGIKYQVLDRRKDSIEYNFRNYKMPIVLSSWSFVSDGSIAVLAAKTINLVNSNPINIK